jgi:hypothetical protein
MFTAQRCKCKPYFEGHCIYIPMAGLKPRHEDVTMWGGESYIGRERIENMSFPCLEFEGVIMTCSSLQVCKGTPSMVPKNHVQRSKYLSHVVVCI